MTPNCPWILKSIEVKESIKFNLFLANVSILYPLKTPENLTQENTGQKKLRIFELLL